MLEAGEECGDQEQLESWTPGCGVSSRGVTRSALVSPNTVSLSILDRRIEPQINRMNTDGRDECEKGLVAEALLAGDVVKSFQPQMNGMDADGRD